MLWLSKILTHCNYWLGILGVAILTHLDCAHIGKVGLVFAFFKKALIISLNLGKLLHTWKNLGYMNMKDVKWIWLEKEFLVYQPQYQWTDLSLEVLPACKGTLPSQLSNTHTSCLSEILDLTENHKAATCPIQFSRSSWSITDNLHEQVNNKMPHSPAWQTEQGWTLAS